MTEYSESIVLLRDTVIQMESLQSFVVAKLREMGITQTELAARADVAKADINGIVQGRIKLPGADKRRRLASALGVSHLDLLVAAGEITEAELGTVAGIVERAPDDPVDIICERAGVPQIRAHDLRHSYATLMMESNVHPRIVADILGHSTVQMTLDRYSHVSTSMQRAALDAIDDVIGEVG